MSIILNCDSCNLKYSVKFKIIEGDSDDPSTCEPWELDRCIFCGLRLW